MVLHARVKGGEGSLVELVPVDDLDDMDPAERAALEASIARGLEEADRGEAMPADEFLRRLRSRNATSLCRSSSHKTGEASAES